MLSDNLRQTAAAMRHATAAPACDLRAAIAIFADVIEDAARLAAERERIIARQKEALENRTVRAAFSRLFEAMRIRLLYPARVADLDAEFARHVRRGNSETARAICTLVDARAR
jgi:hypothetical protein